MFVLLRKFVALLLAVWLPLFGGNALAVSIVMQSMNGDCHGAQQESHSLQHASVSHQHMHHAQLAINQDRSPLYQEQQNCPHDRQQDSPCNNCGVCQIACSGFLATVAIKMAEAQPLSQSFTLSAAQFQSFTSAPLDPPPLARA